MSAKNLARLRRARQTRIRIGETSTARLTVHRTNAHIYAQITSSSGDKVLATASTLEKELRGQLKHGGNRKAAELVGQRIAEKAKQAGIAARSRATSTRGWWARSRSSRRSPTR